MENLDSIYTRLCNTPSDINEHLPTLRKYASECDHVTEMGTRTVVSTYSLMMGKPKKLISIDIVPIENYGVDRNELKKLAASADVDFEFIVADTRNIEIEETDFLFIDTLHVYPQLKIELMLHGNKAKRYIGFHDTTLFEYTGENSPDDRGLWPAIEEFMAANPQWIVFDRYTNNNGLTILKKINEDI